MIAYIDEHDNLQLIADTDQESLEIQDWFHKIYTKRQPYKLRKEVPPGVIKITYYEEK